MWLTSGHTVQSPGTPALSGPSPTEARGVNSDDMKFFEHSNGVHRKGDFSPVTSSFPSQGTVPLLLPLLCWHKLPGAHRGTWQPHPDGGGAVSGWSPPGTAALPLALVTPRCHPPSPTAGSFPSRPCWARLPGVFLWLVWPETEQAPHLLARQGQWSLGRSSLGHSPRSPGGLVVENRPSTLVAAGTASQGTG